MFKFDVNGPKIIKNCFDLSADQPKANDECIACCNKDNAIVECPDALQGSTPLAGADADEIKKNGPYKMLRANCKSSSSSRLHLMRRSDTAPGQNVWQQAKSLADAPSISAGASFAQAVKAAAKGITPARAKSHPERPRQKVES